MCIGGGDANFTGGVEYVLDCDTNDQGCNGGYLDDAWEFLMKTGMPSETCVPYTHCDDPASPDCKPTFLGNDVYTDTQQGKYNLIYF